MDGPGENKKTARRMESVVITIQGLEIFMSSLRMYGRAG